MNEKYITVVKAWDGTDLKFTFRRTVSSHGMSLWYHICNIAESIPFSNDCDAIIWSLNSCKVYSVQSLYAIVSFNGIKPVPSPAV
jgi:hypothetical protein